MVIILIEIYLLFGTVFACMLFYLIDRIKKNDKVIYKLLFKKCVLIKFIKNKER